MNLLGTAEEEGLLSVPESGLRTWHQDCGAADGSYSGSRYLALQTAESRKQTRQVVGSNEMPQTFEWMATVSDYLVYVADSSAVE